MELLESRRLTGLSVVWDKPGAIVDLALADDEDRNQIAQCWHLHVRRMLDAVGWQSEHLETKEFIGGLSLALSAPIDALYGAAEIAEWGVQACVVNPDGSPTADFEKRRDEFLAAISAERNPRLLEIQAGACKAGVAFLSDDDVVSAGLGRGSQSWSVRELPERVAYESLYDVPVALVTGTNGKTTTVRLASHILRASGLNVGLSSTDWISVNDRVLDRGDYSGPGGARAVLRERDVDVAVLETARGGLLRRGLGVERADVALITNIAEDHLGDYGSQDLNELLDLKWIVMQALDERSLAILNADDPMLLERAASLPVKIDWFSLTPEHEVFLKPDARGYSVVDNQIAVLADGEWQLLCPLDDIPITLNGAALHNIANALAATALTRALGVDDAALRRGLSSMQMSDNPGRCNLFELDGRTVLLDFAHNPDAMQAIFHIAEALPAKRRVLCFGQAGDRTDEQIRELADKAFAIGLEQVIVSELRDYLRGREPGQVFSLLSEQLMTHGLKDTQISHNEWELESLQQAIAWSEPGDLIIMLALGESRQVLEYLHEHAELIT